MPSVLRQGKKGNDVACPAPRRFETEMKPFHRPFFIPRSHPPVLSFHAPPPAYNPIPRKTLKVNPIDNPIDLQHLPRFALLKQIWIPFRQGAIQTSKTIVSELCGLRSSKGRAFPCTGSLPVAKQYECLLRFIGVDISFHERNRLRFYYYYYLFFSSAGNRLVRVSPSSSRRFHLSPIEVMFFHLVGELV